MPALVIVESPTKARTIRKFLGSDYIVEASMGHVRDLPSSAAEIPAEVKGQPWSRLAVNVDHGFEPVYIIPNDKKKVVTELKRALKTADRLYIATDEDREGESIGWHLVDVLKPKVPTYRMVFHEITNDAIKKALNSPREIDERLVQAQEARRVLDRLVGYIVSPLLWHKIAPKLSAGRVQSVAVRLLVMRERERIAFVPANWWDLKAQTTKSNQPFEAMVHSLGGKVLASGKDFDDATGKLKNHRCLYLDQAGAEALAARLRGTTLTVTSVDRKVSERTPYPPFTTSTLQQEANRKLGLSSAVTMKIAQQLYENGHITYMRTDSVNLSNEAINATRGMIARRYGENYLHATPRTYTTKSKGAQEAHEAIRPAGTQMATADELGLHGDQWRLYDLIWKRTAATQMANARIASTQVRLNTKDPADNAEVELRASGRQVVFPGFLLAYVNGSDDPQAALDDADSPLPELHEGDALPCLSVLAQGHVTRPPARYTEAALVKELENQGIGRPSTYASIIETIQRRGYVQSQDRTLVPTFTAFSVTSLLEQNLARIVDVEFTASMESWLDQIGGKADAEAYLRHFYEDELEAGVAEGEKADPRESCTLHYEDLGPYSVRIGRYGPYVEYEQDGERKIVSLPGNIAPADITHDYIEDLVQKAAKGSEALGYDENGTPVYVMQGRFGPYVQLGEVVEGEKPVRQSLTPGVTPENITIETALRILALPRDLGPHPEDGEPVKASVGRFGPYVVHKGVFASLKKEDNVLTIELPRALELFALKGTRGTRRTNEPLKTLGEHPEDGAVIAVLDGRYGPYVKHGSVNATLPQGVTPESITLEQALELLSAKAQSPSKTRKTATRKSSAAKEAAPKQVKAQTTEKKPATRAKKATDSKEEKLLTPEQAAKAEELRQRRSEAAKRMWEKRRAAKEAAQNPDQNIPF